MQCTSCEYAFMIYVFFIHKKLEEKDKPILTVVDVLH